MTIYFYDGSTAECSEIEISNNQVFWDGYRYASLTDVEKIERTGEEKI